MKIKIALVHEFLTQRGGAEKVLQVFHEMFPEAPVYTLIYDRERTGDFFNGWDIRTSFVQKFPLAAKKHRYYLPFMARAIESFDFSGYDLVLSDGSSFAKGAVSKKEAFHINYCHTPTRFLWSDRKEYVAQYRKNIPVRLTLISLLRALKKWDLQASARPDRMIANSRFVAERIGKYYGRESTVIYPPVETEKFGIAEKIGDYYALASRLVPYKRVDLVIEAFNGLKLPLKIIGTGEDMERLMSMAGPNIEFLGWISDKEKAKVLSECLALIHPQVEDFGLTPVEAMACGRPAIAYRAGGALETVIEGKTGIFFDRQNAGSLAEAVRNFRSEEFDPEEIRRHAEKFGKDRFKEEIRSFISSATGRKCQ